MLAQIGRRFSYRSQPYLTYGLSSYMSAMKGPWWCEKWREGRIKDLTYLTKSLAATMAFHRTQRSDHIYTFDTCYVPLIAATEQPLFLVKSLILRRNTLKSILEPNTTILNGLCYGGFSSDEFAFLPLLRLYSYLNGCSHCMSVVALSTFLRLLFLLKEIFFIVNIPE